MNKIVACIFFGNWFYALCAVALTLSSSMLQGYVLTYISYYLLLFFSTVFYYQQAYQGAFFLRRALQAKKIITLNARQQWYDTHFKTIHRLQVLLCLGIVVSLMVLLRKRSAELHYIKLQHVVVISIIVLTGIFYYGDIYFPGKKVTLRIALAKPFIIAFVWAGITVLLPAVMISIVQQKEIFTGMALFCFIDHFIFISILCILFDIKDYEDDTNANLKTFIVRLGIEKTQKILLVPITLFYFAINAAITFYGMQSKLHILRYAVVTIALLLLIRKMTRKHHLLFYLIIIDGLMLLKALIDVIVIIVINKGVNQ